MKLTIDEQNDALRNQVGAELPRPMGGFESSDQEDEYRARADARFLELCASEVRAATAWGNAAAAAEAWGEAKAAAAAVTSWVEAASWVEARAKAEARAKVEA